jgi:hypothetical protein
MKNLFLLLSSALLMPFLAHSQVSLPQPSPKNTVSQMVGLSEVVVEYSRPAVKGRQVWGSLVPYGQVWRTGANSATWISLSHDAIIADKPVKAGKYAIFTIPTENEWTIVLNTNEGQWGSTNHKPEFDVAQVKVKPVKTKEIQERLLFVVEPQSDDEATLVLKWEYIQVSVPIKFNTKDIAKSAVEKTMSGMWYTYANSAMYYYENNIDMQKAVEMVNLSISMNDKHFFNRWVKALILAKQGKTSEALIFAQEAEKIGNEIPADKAGFYNVYKADIASSIAAWKKK